MDSSNISSTSSSSTSSSTTSAPARSCLWGRAGRSAHVQRRERHLFDRDTSHMLHDTSFWKRLNDHLLRHSRDRGLHLQQGSVENLHHGQELHDLLHCAPLDPLMRSSHLRQRCWPRLPGKRRFLVRAQPEVLGAAGFCLRGAAWWFLSASAIATVIARGEATGGAVAVSSSVRSPQSVPHS